MSDVIVRRPDFAAAAADLDPPQEKLKKLDAEFEDLKERKKVTKASLLELARRFGLVGGKWLIFVPWDQVSQCIEKSFKTVVFEHLNVIDAPWC